MGNTHGCVTNLKKSVESLDNRVDRMNKSLVEMRVMIESMYQRQLSEKLGLWTNTPSSHF